MVFSGPLCATLSPVNKRILSGVLCGFVSLLFSSCKNAEGRWRPPDPLGYAIFEALDRGPRTPQGQAIPDSQYVDDGSLAARGHPPSPDSIWVDGTWGMANGRRIWIPAHWQ